MSFPPARSRAGFVSACQQVLALGAVVAVLTPAASVITLDVVHEDTPAPGALATRAATLGQDATAQVPTAAVDADVAEYQLTAPTSGRTASRAVAPDALSARTVTGRGGAAEVVSDPLEVDGFGTVGVTWDAAAALDDDDIAVEVRTSQDGDWSRWSEVPYEAEHAPDPGTAEAAAARPGTDAMLVGDVDEVQVRVDSDAAPPKDLRLAVIDPGEPVATVEQGAALGAATAAAGSTGSTGSAGVVAPRAASLAAPQPTIFSRAQWGADERMRSAGSLRYGTVEAGFVHHTVNTNAYSRTDVPGILRSIYAYHTRSLGWSDIGYNFLVDRFGRIWEGRYGGVTRAPVGAHTYGYNDDAFAMSAIGNFETTTPSSVMIRAYGALFAWKLGIHGVDASSMRRQVGSRVLPAINGHRDVGATACPGINLFRRLGDIRRLAVAAQGEATPPTPPTPPPPASARVAVTSLDSDLVGDEHPDLALRRRSDGRAVILPTGGLTTLQAPRALAAELSAWPDVLASPDLTGDGVGDLVLRRTDGTTAIAAGRGEGAFSSPVRVSSGPRARHELLTATGDVDGDGRADLAARVRGTSRLTIFRGDGAGGFRTTTLRRGWGRYDLVLGAGDLTGDGRPDLLARTRDGRMFSYAGRRGVRFSRRAPVWGGPNATWAGMDQIAAAGDMTGDGRADLVVRRARDGAGFVLPGTGRAQFGRGFGPLVKAESLRSMSGGIQVGAGPAPDLLARRAGRLVWLPHADTVETRDLVETGVDASRAGVLLNAGDWDRDGHGDLLTRTRGVLELHRGDGRGDFAPPVALGSGLARLDDLAVVGDVTGDGWPDLAADRADGTTRIYPGHGTSALGEAGAAVVLVRDGDQADLRGYDWTVPVEDLRGSGAPDLVSRDAAGRLWVLPVTSRGVGQRRYLADGLGGYDVVG